MRYFVLLLIVASQQLMSQEVPIGYLSYFKDEFSAKEINANIRPSRSMAMEQSKGVLKLNYSYDSLNSFFPQASFIIDNKVFGDFNAQVKFRSDMRIIDSLRSFYLIVGLKDSLNYYLAEINMTGVYFSQVYRGEKTLLHSDSSLSITDSKWVNLRVSRSILERSLILANENKRASIKDPNFVMGYLGFGIGAGSIELDRIEVWAPTIIEKPLYMFP